MKTGFSLHKPAIPMKAISVCQRTKTNLASLHGKVMPCLHALYFITLEAGMYVCVSSVSQMRQIIYTTASCSELSDPANGIVIWTGLTTGSLAAYACDNGYQFTGERIRTCMSNGTWSGQDPTCIRKKNAFVMCTHLYK